MSDVIGYDLDFYPKEIASPGEPWEVKLCEQLETGELRPVANGYGYDDFAALRDLIERLTAGGSPVRMIAAVCESYALRLREQMQWPSRRPAGSVTQADRRHRAPEPDPSEHRVQFVTVALRERLIVMPCTCDSDRSRPGPADVRGFVTDQVA
jgi:hypothetical protein